MSCPERVALPQRQEHPPLEAKEARPFAGANDVANGFGTPAAREERGDQGTHRTVFPGALDKVLQTGGVALDDCSLRQDAVQHQRPEGIV